MHCASICQGGAADDSGKYHRVDHLSAPDLADNSQNIQLGLTYLYIGVVPTDPCLPNRDIIEHGVRKVANAMD